MLPNRLGVPQVMVLPDEIIEEFFLRCSANLTEFDWRKLRQGDVDWFGVVEFKSCLGTLSPFGVVVIVNDSWWKSYQIATFKMEQEPATYYIFQMPVGLPPIPSFAEYTGNGTAAFTLVLIDDLANKGKIVLGNILLYPSIKPLSEFWVVPAAQV